LAGQSERGDAAMKIGRRCFLVCVPGVLAGLAALVLAVPAAADPALRVPKRKLNRALHCHPQVRDARTEPVLLLTGTGAKGTDTWASEPDFQATLRGGPPPELLSELPPLHDRRHADRGRVRGQRHPCDEATRRTADRRLRDQPGCPAAALGGCKLAGAIPQGRPTLATGRRRARQQTEVSFPP
jgi:hypothetical protein